MTALLRGEGQLARQNMSPGASRLARFARAEELAAQAQISPCPDIDPHLGTPGCNAAMMLNFLCEIWSEDADGIGGSPARTGEAGLRHTIGICQQEPDPLPLIA